MYIAINAESICKANELFWEQMLAMRLEPIEDVPGEEEQTRCIGNEHAIGHCDLSGVWTGRIEVRLSRGLAMQATSAMLMQPIDTVEPGDTLDATKEIANMIAGTLKSALPRPCSMSVPWAKWESDDFCVVPRTHDTVTVFFQHESGELMIRVWEDSLDLESAPPPVILDIPIPANFAA
jgi:CheY-specific phosphatase CheX